jgi:N-acetylneuraminic acid mutarotase
MANMSIAREDLACCLGFDGAIYALGGITSSNDATNSAERFNWQRNNWETIKSMRFSRISFVAVPTPRGIFVIGGHTTKKYLREV